MIVLELIAAFTPLVLFLWVVSLQRRVDVMGKYAEFTSKNLNDSVARIVALEKRISGLEYTVAQLDASGVP